VCQANLIKNIKLRQEAPRNEKSKYRAVINSIMLRLKRRIDDTKEIELKSKQKSNLDALTNVLGRFVNKRD
jgi:hypothetical protein